MLKNNTLHILHSSKRTPNADPIRRAIWLLDTDFSTKSACDIFAPRIHLISASTLVPKQVHSKNAKWRHIVNFRKIKTTPQFRRWFALITIYSPKALSEILFWMFTLIHLIVHYVTTEINDFLAFSCFFIAYKSQKINCFTKKDTKRQVWENASWHLIILWNAEVFLCKTCT